MKALLAYFAQPYPLHIGWFKAMRQGLIFGFFVGAFLVFFRPFGLYEVDRKYDYLLWGFGLVTFLSTVINDGIFPSLFPQLFRERTWNIGRELLFILYNVWFIATANYMYLLLWTSTELSWSAYGRMSAYTIGIGLMPITFGIAFRQRQLYERYKRQADNIQPTAPQEPDDSPILIEGKNDNERLELKTGELLYLEAEGNYVIVGYKRKDVVHKELIRSTLREVLDQLSDHPSVEQVHRSFAANLDRVETVTGNSQGLQLHFAGSEVSIPVSRRKAPEIKGLLEHTVRP
ncbi:LytTR family transcriptional regulator [Cryomorphaceae bacterium]|nr:LytTR family transcriptional regulator [Cryomorphaceae bacterium]